MSAVVATQYALTIEQRLMLREQQARELKIKTESAGIKRCAKELRALCAKIREPLDAARELNVRAGEGSEYISTVEGIINQAYAVIESDIDVSEIPEPDALEQKRKAIESYLELVKQKANTFREEADRVKQQLKKVLSEKIDEGFSLSFDSKNEQTYTKASPNEKPDILQLREQIVQRLKALAGNSLPHDLECEVSSAINNLQAIETIEFLKNYNSVTATPLEKRCRSYISDYEANISKFNELAARQEALCEAMSISFIPTVLGMETMPKLEETVKELEEQHALNIEKEYIADSIDAVMIDMGYQALGSKDVQRSGGRRFRSELYSFDDGTAVNVTYSSDGKITMELGGLANEDRLPSSSEASLLCGGMNHFCEDYVEIEKRLENKGIVLKERISMLPPEEQYAQIINMSDYDMKREAEAIEARRSRARKSNAEMRSRVL